jgi:hypothetical protein
MDVQRLIATMALRAIVPGDQPQRFPIHDRHSVYAAAVDDALTAARVLSPPP